MNKYTVELDEETGLFEVIEWTDNDDNSRHGKAVVKTPFKRKAYSDCKIRNAVGELESLVN